jgi:hypothetical protein
MQMQMYESRIRWHGFCHSIPYRKLYLLWHCHSWLYASGVSRRKSNRQISSALYFFFPAFFFCVFAGFFFGVA